MSPTRIMIIRHGEKPGEPSNGGEGVTLLGEPDEESLTVRGWQRAGALAVLFAQPPMRPDIIFASGVGHGSKSKRPQETVTPLAELLNVLNTGQLVTTHLKNELQLLIEDVLSREGAILISWQHELIPSMVGKLRNPPAVPEKWPDDRFDMVWVLDAVGSGWKFSQVPQMLLAGDKKTDFPG